MWQKNDKLLTIYKKKKIPKQKQQQKEKKTTKQTEKVSRRGYLHLLG